MKKITLIFALLPFACFAQKEMDNKILISIEPGINVVDAAKKAFAKNDIQLREDGNKDTIQSFSTQFNNLFVKFTILVKGNTLELAGEYSRLKIDDWGYMKKTKTSEPVLYYKGSKMWKLMAKVANDFGGQISYEKN